MTNTSLLQESGETGGREKDGSERAESLLALRTYKNMHLARKKIDFQSLSYRDCYGFFYRDLRDIRNASSIVSVGAP